MGRTEANGPHAGKGAHKGEKAHGGQRAPKMNFFKQDGGKNCFANFSATLPLSKWRHHRWMSYTSTSPDPVSNSMLSELKGHKKKAWWMDSWNECSWWVLPECWGWLRWAPTLFVGGYINSDWRIFSFFSHRHAEVNRAYRSWGQVLIFINDKDRFDMGIAWYCIQILSLVAVITRCAAVGVCKQFAPAVGPDAQFHQISSTDGQSCSRLCWTTPPRTAQFTVSNVRVTSGRKVQR